MFAKCADLIADHHQQVKELKGLYIDDDAGLKVIQFATNHANSMIVSQSLKHFPHTMS